MDDEDHYFRLVTFTVEGCPKPQRELFLQKATADRRPGVQYTKLDTYLHFHRQTIHQMVKRKHINSSQLSHIFPLHGYADIQEWDVTLVSSLLQGLFNPLPHKEQTSINEIRDVRNQLLHIAPEGRVNDDEFDVTWDLLKKATLYLAGCVNDPNCKIQTDAYINKLKFKPLPAPGPVLDILKQWYAVDISEMKDDARNAKKAATAAKRSIEHVVVKTCNRTGTIGKRMKVYDQVLANLQDRYKCTLESYLPSDRMSSAKIDDIKIKLRENHRVVVSGYNNTETVMTALSAVKDMQYDDKRCIQLEAADEWMHVCGNDVELVVCDNPFGKDCYDSEASKQMSKHFDWMLSITKLGDDKRIDIVIISGHDVLKECRRNHNHDILDEIVLLNEGSKKEPMVLDRDVLPKEILRMDERSIDIYKQALTEGKVAVHNIRVMVVGHVNVGKTALTKRMLGEMVDLNSHESTNGIDVHVRKCKVSLQDGQWAKLTQEEMSDDIPKKRLVKMLRNFKESNDPNEFLESADGMSERNVGTDIAKSSNLETIDVTLETTDVTLETPDVTLKTSTANESEGGDKPEGNADSEKLQVLLNDLKMTRTLENADPNSADLSIWDFAGQYAFYATHQLFLSSRAVYLLVTDISKHINGLVIGDDSYFDNKESNSCNIYEFVNFWMKSIHVYCASDETGVPPVILIGTHADQLDKNDKEEKSEAYFEAIRSLFSDNVTQYHLANEDFAVDNTIDDPKLCDLKKKILEVASQQAHWGESIPAKWITLEMALSELRDQGSKMIKMTDIEARNNDLPVALRTPDELQLFLRFQHDLGTIVYFSDECLKEYVLLDPQWLVDAFKCIITAKRFYSKKPNVFQKWQEFNRKGLLRLDLIEAVWKKGECDGFYEHRNHLLGLMEKLDIIAKPRYYNDDVLDVEVQDYFYVTSVLKENPPTEYVTPCQSEDFVSTSIMCFTNSSRFIPPALFNRLLAACVNKWPISTQNKTNLIFCGCCLFDIYHSHRLTIYLLENVIQIWVTKFGRKYPFPDASICADARMFVEQTLERITNHMDQTSKLEQFVKCPDVIGVSSGLLPWSDFLTHGECSCNDHDKTHILEASRMLRFWLSGNTDGKTDIGPEDDSIFTDQLIDSVPSDRQLATIAHRIGKEYQQLFYELGFNRVEVEHSQMNNPLFVVDQIRNLFIQWRDNCPTRATFRKLETAMRKVNIDTVYVFRGSVFMK